MILSKTIQFIRENQNDIILVVGVILISLLSFAAGFITARQSEKESLEFERLDVNKNSVVDEILISSPPSPVCDGLGLWRI